MIPAPMTRTSVVFTLPLLQKAQASSGCETVWLRPRRRWSESLIFEAWVVTSLVAHVLVCHRSFVTSRANQVREGKTPTSAMMKVKTRYGGMLLWGRLPPVTDRATGDMVTLLAEDGV